LDPDSGLIYGIPTAAGEAIYIVTATSPTDQTHNEIDLLALPGYVVDSMNDNSDAVAFDGICADAGGACTLRAAVMTANQIAGRELILLPQGTYGLDGVLDFTTDTVVAGAEVTRTTIR